MPRRRKNFGADLGLTEDQVELCLQLGLTEKQVELSLLLATLPAERYDAHIAENAPERLRDHNRGHAQKSETLSGRRKRRRMAMGSIS